MSNQDLQPGEIEEETHIITERIIEEPSDEENEDLFEEYVIKGAAFTLGAVLFLLVATGLFALIFEDGILSTIFGILLGLLIVAGIAEYVEE